MKNHYSWIKTLVEVLRNAAKIRHFHSLPQCKFAFIVWINEQNNLVLRALHGNTPASSRYAPKIGIPGTDFLRLWGLDYRESNIFEGVSIGGLHTEEASITGFSKLSTQGVRESSRSNSSRSSATLSKFYKLNSHDDSKVKLVPRLCR